MGVMFTNLANYGAPPCGTPSPFFFSIFSVATRPRSQGTPPGFPTVQALGPCHTGAVGQEDLGDVAPRHM